MSDKYEGIPFAADLNEVDRRLKAQLEHMEFLNEEHRMRYEIAQHEARMAALSVALMAGFVMGPVVHRLGVLEA